MTEEQAATAENPEEQPDDERAEDVEEELESSATHVDKRTMIFPEQRTLFVPVPKAGCTAVMWNLAKVAGLEEERFYTSSYRGQVSRSLTIHDLSNWPDDYLYAKLSPERKKEILDSDEWFRFTVVRHPFRRLWSAWQSKILLAEPQFIKRFSSEAWFPSALDSAADVLKWFRQFLEALEENDELVTADPHWAPQVGVASYGEMPYSHVGRVEKLGETIEALRAHLQSVNGQTFPDLPRENVTPLPYLNELFTEADARILGQIFGDDLSEFGYDAPPAPALQAPPSPTWMEAVDAVMPAIQALRDRNERVGDLESIFKERREVLQGRIREQRERLKQQKGRIDTQQQRIADQRKRLNTLGRFRAEERRRNERLQNRLFAAQKENRRMKNSASWRYTAPLRRVGRLGRKALGRNRRG